MKKIFIKHNGCLNLSYDFNITKAGLERAGYIIVDEPEEADEIIFAGCGVRSFWVDDAIKQVNAYNKHNKKVIITGCISNIETDRIKNELICKNIDFLDFHKLIADYTPYSFNELDKIIIQNSKSDFEGDSPLRKKLSKTKHEILLFFEKLDRKYGIDLSNEYKKTTKGFFFYNEDDATEFITVTRGCPYKCAYCTIPKGRGKYTSVNIEDIICKVKNAVDNDIYKIVLIGDEIGNYGLDTKYKINFKKLINEILSVNEKIKIALRYIEPTPFLKNFDFIKKMCEMNRIYLLHIPLQTGSQRLLKEMKRNYNLEKIVPAYKYIIDNTNTAMYCNWMVGYPGESEDDFNKTLQLAMYLKVHLNTVIPFSARPNTEAYDRDDKISQDIIKKRSDLLEQVLYENKVEYLLKFINNIRDEDKKKVLDLLKKEYLEDMEKELR